MLLWQLSGPSSGQEGAALRGVYGTTVEPWTKGIESGIWEKKLLAWAAIPRREIFGDMLVLDAPCGELWAGCAGDVWLFVMRSGGGTRIPSWSVHIQTISRATPHFHPAATEPTGYRVLCIRLIYLPTR